MKKVLLAALLLGLALPAYAQEDTERPIRLQEQRVKEARENRQDIRDQLESQRDERKEIIETRKQIIDEREQIKGEIKGELETLRATTREEFRAAETVTEKQKVLEEARFEKEALKQRAEAAKQEFLEKVKGVFSERISVGVRIFETHILRAATMNTRIEEGLDKLEARGIDTSSVSVHLDTAAGHIEAATAAVDDAKEQLAAAEAEGDEAVRAAVESVKSNFATGREEIKKAFEALRLAVTEFKTLLKENKPTETPEEPIAE